MSVTDYEVTAYLDGSITGDVHCLQLMKQGKDDDIVARKSLFIRLEMTKTVAGEAHKRERREKESAYRTH